jgi:hypothetical protein
MARILKLFYICILFVSCKPRTSSSLISPSQSQKSSVASIGPNLTIFETSIKKSNFIGLGVSTGNVIEIQKVLLQITKNLVENYGYRSIFLSNAALGDTIYLNSCIVEGDSPCIQRLLPVIQFQNPDLIAWVIDFNKKNAKNPVYFYGIDSALTPGHLSALKEFSLSYSKDVQDQTRKIITLANAATTDDSNLTNAVNALVSSIQSNLAPTNSSLFTLLLKNTTRLKSSQSRLDNIQAVLSIPQSNQGTAQGIVIGPNSEIQKNGALGALLTKKFEYYFNIYMDFSTGAVLARPSLESLNLQVCQAPRNSSSFQTWLLSQNINVFVGCAKDLPSTHPLFQQGPLQDLSPDQTCGFDPNTYELKNFDCYVVFPVANAAKVKTSWPIPTDSTQPSNSTPWIDESKIGANFKPHVLEARRKGFISGFDTNEFRPIEPITREQMAAIVQNYLNKSQTYSTEGLPVINFSDVPSTRWSYKSIAFTSSLNIFKGYDDGKFHPSDILTRAQMLQVLFQILKLKDPAIDSPNIAINIPFLDVSKHWIQGTVSKLINSCPSITQGDNLLSPKFVNSDEFVSVPSRYFSPDAAASRQYVAAAFILFDKCYP